LEGERSPVGLDKLDPMGLDELHPTGLEKLNPRFETGKS